MTRGSRATKNTWASTLSAYGIVRLNTRASEIDVLPTIGATRQQPIVNAPKVAMVTRSRRRTSVRSRKRHHGQMTGARMQGHVGVHAVQRTYVGGVQHANGRSMCEHAARLQ